MASQQKEGDWSKFLAFGIGSERAEKPSNEKSRKKNLKVQEMYVANARPWTIQ
jgi:hypothetical protein